MPGQIKVGGAWKTMAGQFVKVGGAWHSVTSGWVKVGGVWKQWFVGAFSDNFTRTTSGSLGASSSGGTWTAIKGIWFANGTMAQSNDLPSNNSIATMTLGSSNITLNALSVTNGTGISFLVADASNWWAAAAERTDTSYSYVYYVAYTSATPIGYYVTGSYNYTYTATAPTGTYTNTSYTYTITPDTYTWNHGSYGYFIVNSASIYGYTIQFGTYSYYTLNPGTYGTGTTSTANYYSYTATGTANLYAPYYSGTYSVNASATTTTYYLRLYNSVAGTVSTIANLALTALATSLRVKIAGTSVTATAYSDNTQVTSVGSVAYTLASTPTATNHGIILTTSDTAQGYTLGYFTASLV